MIVFTSQGSHRVVWWRKLSRAEAGEHKRGLYTLLILDIGGLPREKIHIIALLCAFLLGFFYALETILVVLITIFARKAIILRVRIRMLDKIYFRQSLFSPFLQHVSLTYAYAGLWQSTLSTNPMVVFMKIYTLAPFLLEHPWVCLDFGCITLLDFPCW